MLSGVRVRKFIERSADVPAELRRNTALIRDLDEQVEALHRELGLAVQKQLQEEQAAEEAKASSSVPPVPPADTKSPRAGGRAGAGGSKAKLSKAGGSQRDVPAAVAPEAVAPSSPSAPVKTILQKMAALAEEKVTIASQMYSFVDQQIKMLDEDLAALEKENAADRTRLGLQEHETACGRLGIALPRFHNRRGGGGGSSGPAGTSATVSAAGSDGGTGGGTAAAGDGWLSDPQQPLSKKQKKTGKAAGKADKAAEAVVVDPGDLAVAYEDLSSAALEGPLYCLCQKPSYGQMVGCDNEDCPLEWFHLGCVGLTEPPGEEGAWLCPQCRGSEQPPGAAAVAPAAAAAAAPALAVAVPPAGRGACGGGGAGTPGKRGGAGRGR